MGIMTGCALNLVVIKRLNSVRKGATPILLRDGRLVKGRVFAECRVSDRDGVIVFEVLGQVSDRRIVGAAQSRVGPPLPVMAFSATVRTDRSLRTHTIVNTGIKPVMKFWFVDHGIHRHRSIVTGQTAQGNAVRRMGRGRIEVGAGIHLVAVAVQIRKLAVPEGGHRTRLMGCVTIDAGFPVVVEGAAGHRTGLAAVTSHIQRRQIMPGTDDGSAHRGNRCYKQPSTHNNGRCDKPRDLHGPLL